MPSVPHRIARETIVSAIVNAVISVGFFLLVFGTTDPVKVWGRGGYAVDFVPQSLAIGFMAALVPPLVIRKTIDSNRFGGSATSAPAIGSILARALLSAAAALTISSSLCAAALWLSGVQAIAYWPAFAAKVLYGAALGAIVTRLTLVGQFAAGPVRS